MVETTVETMVETTVETTRAVRMILKNDEPPNYEGQTTHGHFTNFFLSFFLPLSFPFLLTALDTCLLDFDGIAGVVCLMDELWNEN